MKLEKLLLPKRPLRKQDEKNGKGKGLLIKSILQVALINRF